MTTIIKQVPNKCPICGGSGKVMKLYYGSTAQDFPCNVCKGAGILWSEEKTIIEDEIKEHKCPLC